MLSSQHALLCLLVTGLAGATGCEAPLPRSWLMEFSDPETRDGAVLVEGRVRQGGCEGGVVFVASVRRGGSPASPPALSAGTWGLEGVAIDDDCVEIARGCVNVVLPSDRGPFEIVLENTTLARCAPAECDAGECSGVSDAGESDAGDAGCTVDGGCPECSTCAGPLCEPAMNGTACAGGTCLDATCCTGCVDGDICREGSSPTACGASGRACTACACADDTCAGGACTPARSFVDVEVGDDSTCAHFGADLHCWGENTDGQLAMGSPSDELVLTPTPIRSSLRFTALTSGDEHYVALDAVGRLWAWGNGQSGQLGVGDLGFRYEATRAGVDIGWAFIGAGRSGDHSCAIGAEGELYCTGENQDGQLGLGSAEGTRTTLQPVAPGTTWATVSGGAAFTCGTRTDGSLWCWGANDRGQLGLGGAATRTEPERVGADADWARVSCGRTHCCGIRDGGALYCWGENDAYQIGDGSNTNRFNPVRIGDSSWTFVQGGDEHTCGITTAGVLACWGGNSFGQLGTGRDETQRTPTAIGVSTGWTDLAVGDRHTCGVDRGTLYCWGDNRSGQLGQGDTMQRDVPTPVCR